MAWTEGGERQKVRRPPIRLARRRPRRPRQPTEQQARYLRMALGQPGLKLPLFRADGRPVGERLVDACLDGGWAERWFDDPRLPGICRLTDRGVEAVLAAYPS